MDEDRLRWLAAIIIVAIGLAYMGWLVLTFLETRETGMEIRRNLIDVRNKFTANPDAPVDAEVVNES
jgi:hypothetical protein